MAENSGDLSLGYMMGQSDSGGGNSGGLGGFGDGWLGLILFAMIFGWGGNGFGGGFGGGGRGGGYPCATQADVRAAVDQQTLISKLDQQTYGLADSTYALNNTINGNFRTLDNAICTLGYQNQAGINALSAQMAQCCCDTRAAIGEVNTGIERNGWQISKQISDCCCDIEKMNMQNRYDAQTYNCNTMQAIDKLGDRILGYLNDKEQQNLRDEVQAYRLAASQAKQNEYLVNQLRPCPVPAYITCNPYAASYGFSQNYGGCGCAA